MFISRGFHPRRTFFKKATRNPSTETKEKKRIVLHVETLEDRLAPATLLANFVGSTTNIALTYTGTAGEVTTVSRNLGLYQFSNPSETITVTGSAAGRFTGTGTSTVTQTGPIETIDSFTMAGSLLAGSGVIVGAAGINVVANNISISGFDSITVNSLVAAGGNISLVANAGNSSFINLGANLNASGNLQLQSGSSGTILFTGTPRSIAGANITFTTPSISGSGVDLTMGISGSAALNGSFIGFNSITASPNGGTGSLNLSGTVSAGTFTFNIPVTTTAAATLNGNAIFSTTLSNANNLVIGGTASFAAVNGSGSLQVSSTATFAGTVNQNTLTLSGTANINSSSITATVNQTYSGLVTLGVSATLTAASVALNGGVNGANFGLTITGNATLGGSVSSLTTLSISGNTALNVPSVTAATQTYTGAVTLGNSTNLSGTTIFFGSNLNGSNFDLTLNFIGTTAINGSNFIGVRNLTTGSPGITTLAGSLSTSGAQQFGNTVILVGDTTLHTGSGNISFGGSVDGGYALGLNSTGTTVFSGSVGSTTPLTTISTAFSGTTALNGSGITTSGAQAYNNAVTLGGNPTLNAGSAAITFASTVDGQALTMNNGGTTTFGGVIGGITPLTSLIFNGSGAVNVNVALAIGSGSFTLGGTNTSVTIAGLISGSANLIKTGSGKITFTANNNYTGTTSIQAGILVVNGNQPGTTFSLAGGTLSGTGIVGPVTSTSGTIAPGISGPGILTTGSVTLNSSATLAVTLNGPTPGSGYSQLVVNGTINLNGSTLTETIGPFIQQFGQSFVIIQNSGPGQVMGTFNNLPEGATVRMGSTTFQITYHGGSGQDVALNLIVVAHVVSPFFAVAGNGHVQIRRLTDGSQQYDFTPYGPGYTGGISVAIGDVNGDGMVDLVTGATEGNPHVKVFDGRPFTNGTFNVSDPDASVLVQFFPYPLQFNIGANVAVGDIENDRFADIVTGASAGNPDVRVYSGRDIANHTFNPNGASLLAQWFAYGLGFNVGANVAVGDVNRDGFADIVTGATAGNPDVRVYNGRDIANHTFNPNGSSLLAQFFAYGLQFNIGAFVAVGDTNNDGYAEIVTGASVGNPDVRVYNGRDIANGTFNPAGASLIDQFFAYDLQFNIGAAVALEDFEGTGNFDILTGASQGAPHYRVVHPTSSGISPPALFEGMANGIQGGISVGV